MLKDEYDSDYAHQIPRASPPVRSHIRKDPGQHLNLDEVQRKNDKVQRTKDEVQRTKELYEETPEVVDNKEFLNKHLDAQFEPVIYQEFDDLALDISIHGA